VLNQASQDFVLRSAQSFSFLIRLWFSFHTLSQKKYHLFPQSKQVYHIYIFSKKHRLLLFCINTFVFLNHSLRLWREQYYNDSWSSPFIIWLYLLYLNSEVDCFFAWFLIRSSSQNHPNHNDGDFITLLALTKLKRDINMHVFSLKNIFNFFYETVLSYISDWWFGLLSGFYMRNSSTVQMRDWDFITNK